MKTSKAVVARIRPVSWKVCVEGEDAARYVRSTLEEAGFTCSEPDCEPELQERPMYSFTATSKGETPLTAPELQATFDQDEKIDVAFED